VLLHALLVHILWLASWCRGPHCATQNQLLELELLLLLDLLTVAPASCYLGPWCACQGLFLKLRPMLLLALHLLAPWLSSWCRVQLCAILNQLLDLELMFLLALLTSGLAASFFVCVCDGNVTREDCLTLEALVRLPKLVSGAGAIAAACPLCALSSHVTISLKRKIKANPLAGVSVQGAQVRHPNSVAGAGADAATEPPYLRPSNLIQGALLHLLKLVLGNVASAAACPSFARLLTVVLVQGAKLRNPKSVAGA